MAAVKILLTNILLSAVLPFKLKPLPAFQTMNRTLDASRSRVASQRVAYNLIHLCLYVECFYIVDFQNIFTSMPLKAFLPFRFLM